MSDHAVNVETTDFFVYGTLRRGECRESCWPCDPLAVQIAYVRGALFDLGPYPGMIPGDDWIEGEIWSFGSEDVGTVTFVLDEIEDYNQPGQDNMYERHSVPWHREIDGPAIGLAQTYHYVMLNDLARLSPMRRTDRPGVYWSARRTS